MSDTSLFDLAKETVYTRQQWPAGHSEVIWQGKIHKVVVEEGGRGGGVLFLGLYNGKPGQYVFVCCGYLGPRGWVFNLNDYEYRTWITKATKILRGGKNVQ